MSFTDDSELIKAKLNMHVKKRLKESPQKRKVDPTTPEDPPQAHSPKKQKQKTKKMKPKKLELDDDEESNSEDRAADASDAGGPDAIPKVSTLDVLQVLLNQKKVSLLRDESVIEFLRKKQIRFNKMERGETRGSFL